MTSGRKYKWFALGDINGFFGLMFDNVTVLSFLAGVLVLAFGFPADIVYTKMFPGTALAYCSATSSTPGWRSGSPGAPGTRRSPRCRSGSTHPPPSAWRWWFSARPSSRSRPAGWSRGEAAMMTWYIGMATMVMMGVIKLALSFCGGWIQKVVPQAGLLGSLAGIGLALIGFTPLVDIFGLPLVGMVSLGLILYTLVAKDTAALEVSRECWPRIAVGTALYHLLGPAGLVGSGYAPPAGRTAPGLPDAHPRLREGSRRRRFNICRSRFHFALLTVVGGINVTESARVAGDDFKTRDILLTEAVATLRGRACAAAWPNPRPISDNRRTRRWDREPATPC